MYSPSRSSFTKLGEEQSSKGFKKTLLETVAIILIATALGALFVYGFDRDEDNREKQEIKWRAGRH